MTAIRPVFPAFLLVCVAIAAGAPVRAQCLDWATGFGPTEQGFGNGEVRALIVHDDGSGSALYAGGDFSSVAGQPIANIARWNGTSWSALGGGTIGLVRCLALHDDGGGTQLFAGGDFTQIGGVTAQRIARWDGAAWTDVSAGVNFLQIYALAVHDEGTGPTLYAGGRLLSVGGIAATGVARWSGTAWTAVGTGLGNEVMCLASHDDGGGAQLYAGGLGTTFGPRLQRWNGTSWAAVGLPPAGGSSATVLGLAPFAGDLFAGGLFTLAGGSSANNVTRWTGAGYANFPTIDPVNGQVNCGLELASGLGGGLVIGGKFTGAGSGPAYRIASWNGSAWSPLGFGAQPGLQGTSLAHVNALCIYDDGTGPHLYVGGEFDQAGYKPSKNIAKWGVPCSAPSILVEPTDLTATFPSTATFSVTATGTAELGYQWRHNFVNVVNTPGRFEGANEPTLRIYGWAFADAGDYDCVVTNAFGQAISQAAYFTIPAGGVTGTPVQLTRIVTTGDAAVGGPPGTFYTLLRQAWQSVDGVPGVHAELTGTLAALARWNGNEVEVGQYRTQQAPGLPAGVLFGNGAASPLERFVFASAGQTAFLTGLTGPGVDSMNSAGIWHRDATSTVLVSRMGDAMPDGPAGSVVGEFEDLALSDSGRVVYRGRTVTASGSYLYRSLRAWDRAQGSVEVFRQNGLAPGTTARFTEFLELRVTPDGLIVCCAALNTGEIGVWVGPPDAIQLAVRSGDAAPGSPAGHLVGGILTTTLVVNDRAEFVFTSLSGPSGGPFLRTTWLWTPAGLVRALGEGDPPPPGFTQPWTVAFPMDLANDGSLLLRGHFPGGCMGCPSQSIWLLEQNGLELIARNNAAPLPEMPAAWTFDNFVSGTLNDLGEVVFQCRHYFGQAYPSVYGWTSVSGVFPIAVPGTQMEVVPGDYRTVSEGSVIQDPNSPFPAPSTNLDSAGRVTLTVYFSNFTRGVFQGQFLHIASLYSPAPAIIEPPQEKRVTTGGTLALSAVVLGLEPLAYRWRKNGVDLYDGSGVTGAGTTELLITPALDSDSGIYSLFASNAWGTVESSGANVSVEPGAPFCTGDGLDPVVTTGCPCSNVGAEGHGCANSVSSAGAVLVATGGTNPDTVVFHASSMPLTVSAIYLKGDSDNLGGTVFGDGVRCVDGSLIRMRTKQNSGGASAFPELGDPSVSVRGQTPPGSGLTGWYQVYYRNAAAAFCPPSTFNVTNGYRITW